MERSTSNLSIRWLYLAVGVAAMLFAGIIYAWSILKAPLEAEFGWTAKTTALNFTLTMCFFCAGGFLGGLISHRAGIRIPIIASGLLAAAGFLITAQLSGESAVRLYLSYGLMAGLGIGVSYNIILSTVGAWFPDKKGLCSGALLMGFGASALVLGNLAGRFIDDPHIGWRTTFTMLGAATGVVLLATGLILRRPPKNMTFPQSKTAKTSKGEAFDARDYTTLEMVRRPTFWRAFLCLILLAAVGNSVISFARDLSLSVGASATLATTLVGVLSVCNGLGRILTGALFDSMGRRITMLAANLLTIASAGVTLVSVLIGSLSLCVAGLCLTGLSYGSCPTVSSSFTAAFYGSRHYATNFGVMNFNLMGASFMATMSSSLLDAFGSYLAPFSMLFILSMAALALNLSIRHP